MALNYGRSSRHIVFGTTSKGPTGPQGPKGVKGDTGSSGPVGGISSISADLSLGNNKIVDLGTPSDDSDASTKGYVDNKVLTRIGHDGSTAMSADLDMGDNRISNLEDPVSGSDASTKMYVDQEAAVVKQAADTYTMLEVGKRMSLDGSSTMTGDLDMGSNKITNLAYPGSGDDASNKGYVDNKVNAGFVNGNNYTDRLINGVLDLGGSRVMTGNLDAGGYRIVKVGDPTVGTDSVNRKYVDGRVSQGIVNSNAHSDTQILGVLDLAGSRVMTGNLDVGGNKIASLGTPTVDTDAATKKYVDENKGSAPILGAGGILDVKSKRITNLGYPGLGVDGASKKYVDDKVGLGYTNSNTYTDGLIGGVLDLGGSRVMTGNLDVGGNKVVAVGAPTVDTDASNKKYVDDSVAGGSVLEADGSLNMNFKKIGNLGAPTSIDDAVTRKYLEDLASKKLNIDGYYTMYGNLSMGNNKITGLGAPTGDTDASTKKYVNDTSTSAQVTTATNLASMGARKVSVDGTSVMSGGLDMGSNGITNLSDPTNDGDAANKKYVDSKSGSGGIADTSKFVTVDKSGYRITYAGGTYKTFSFTTSGYGAPYNGGYGSGLTVTTGDIARVPVVGEVRSMHIEQEPDSSGTADIRVTTPLPNYYWKLAETHGLVFAVGCKYTPSSIPTLMVEQSYSNITQDVKLLGSVGEYRIYLSRIIYDASLTPLTITISLAYQGLQRMVIDLYPGFVFDGIDQAKYYASSLSVNSHYPTYPQFDHHKFIDSTVGDVLVAGVQNPDGFVTVDKLLITEKNIDTSPSNWFHTETGKSFVTDLPFGAVVRGVNTFTYHRMTLPPAKKITLIVMSVDGNTILGNSMVFELGAKFYVGGGASTTGKLTDIKKSDALIRCEGVTHLNKDIVVNLPNMCIGFEMYMRQTDMAGSELNKKITMLVRVFSG